MNREDETAKEPTIPHRVVSASIDNDNMVKSWREYLNVSQLDLAGQMGVSIDTLNEMEKPHAATSQESLSRVAAALGISIEQLDI